jgi:Tfp pilus assembly protein PilZ
VERRRSARLAIVADVDLTSGDNFFAGRARDISLGGLFLEVDFVLEIGTVVVVRLTLLSETYEFPCEVVWTLGDPGGPSSGLGLRFLSLSAAARAGIEAFMQRRAPVAFEPAEGGYGKQPPPLPSG